MLRTVSLRSAIRMSPPFVRTSSITPISAPSPALAMYLSPPQLTTML